MLRFNISSSAPRRRDGLEEDAIAPLHSLEQISSTDRPDVLWSCAEQTEGDLKIFSVHHSSHLFVYQFVPQFGRPVDSFQPTVHTWFLIRCAAYSLTPVLSSF